MINAITILRLQVKSNNLKNSKNGGYGTRYNGGGGNSNTGMNMSVATEIRDETRKV